MYLQFGKRFFDFIVASVCLVILSPIMAFVAISILLTSGVPILFIQERVGRKGKFFKIKKFRTMYLHNVKDSSITVAGDQRITPIGHYLRRWKLDELPQFWNVLVGEMSLVGPRPDVPGYADKLQGNAQQLLLLRPGITGPATLAYKNEEEILAKVSDPVLYNNEIIYPDKVRINLEYMKSCSLWEDLYYCFQTIYR